jgi:hypothetical protein
MSDVYTWCVLHFPARAEHPSFPGEDHTLVKTCETVTPRDLDSFCGTPVLMDGSNTTLLHLQVDSVL